MQILPQKTNLGSRLGQAFGQNLNQASSQTAQQGYQRGQLQQALGKLKDIPENATPMQAIGALIEATAGIPGAERYVGQLAPLILERSRANQAPPPEDIIPGGISAQGQAPNFQQPQQQMKGGQIGAQGNAPQPQNFANPVLEKGTNIQLAQFLPYNLGEQVSPENRMKILDDVKRGGGDVDFTRQQIDDYNAGKISQTDLANANVDKETAQQQKQFAQEAQIAQYLGPKLPEKLDEGTKVLYQHLMAKNLSKSKGMDEAFLNTQRDIQNFDKMRSEWIKNIPDGNMMGMTESQTKQQGSSAKPMLDLDPVAYNILESAMVQKGNSIVDASHTLKPVTPSLHNTLNKAEDYRAYIYPKYDLSDKMMQKNIDEAQERQSKEVPKLAKDFEKIWDKGISLINIYTDLSRKGWFPAQINELFVELAPNFDSQQKVEHTQLNKHPRIPVRYLTK